MGKPRLSYIPFTTIWIVRHHLGEAKTILDVGCGDGALMKLVNYDKKYKVTGIDLYKPSLKTAKKTGVYNRVMQGDVKNLKFKDNSFDVVFSSQVIEHLTKKESLKIISKMEKISKNKIVISTTHGFVPFIPYEVMDDNPLQIHKSGWEIKEMEGYGYKVYGQAARFIYHTEKGLLYKFRGLKDIFVMIAFILAPIIYYYPQLSTFIFAVKRKNKSKYE